ncbi:hypothetical protein MMC18_008364 [Xylographa bjoerkii]|nr:hypothetical protein [Xylographa bjoerkii]
MMQSALQKFNGTGGMSQKQTIRNQTRPMLLKLPDELLCMVFGQIVNPQDLNKLSTTCKRAHTLVSPILFKHVTLRIPRIWNEGLGFIEWLLVVDTKALAHTECLMIITVPQDSMDRSLETLKLVADEIERPGIIYQSTLNQLVRVLIRRIPKGRLRSFRWNHINMVEFPTIDLLLQQHGSTLKELEIDDVRGRFRDRVKVPLALEAIADSSGLHKYSILKIAASSQQTLHSLKLGTDVETANDRTVTNDGVDLYEILHKEMDPIGKTGSSPPHFSLRVFHLTGYTLLTPPPNYPLVITRHEVLQDLRLESCVGVSRVLASLALINNFKLKRFWLRQEEDDEDFIDSLTEFLTSFAGLNHLSVLLDNATAEVEPEYLIYEHYPTLKTLVWECRLRPTTSISIDRPFPDHAMDSYITNTSDYLADHCQALEELGLTISWNTDPVDRGYSAQTLGLLPNLRTIHVRNLPAVDEKTVQLMAFYNTNTGIMERGGRRFTRILAETLYKDICQTLAESPKLEVIAIGAPTIADRRIGKGLSRSEKLNDFLKPRVFLVERLFNIGGDQTDTIQTTPEFSSPVGPGEKYQWSIKKTV